MKKYIYSFLFVSATLTMACKQNSTSTADKSVSDSTFEISAEGFADLQTMRYQVPGFEKLSVQQKTLAYYLYEAALSGRDIIYDQQGGHSLIIRKTLEAI